MRERETKHKTWHPSGWVLPEGQTSFGKAMGIEQ